MRIDSLPPATQTTGSVLANAEDDRAPRLTTEQALQSLFSTILGQQGREGWQSATKMPTTDSSVSESISEQWTAWFHSVHHDRYQSIDDPINTAQSFQTLLIDAQQKQAYAAPQFYVQSLDRSLLKTLQSIHHLADPIDPNVLTEEGAINLLLPPAAQIDLNHDGLTQSGIGYSLRFPDSQTPPEVVLAWQEVTANMPTSEKMLFELRMKVDVILSNIHISPDGRTVTAIEPGDPAFRNPQDAADYSYLRFAKQNIESTEYLKYQMPWEQYQRDLAFWTELADNLQKYGAA